MQPSHGLESKPGTSGRWQDASGCRSPSRQSRKGAPHPEPARGSWPGAARHLPERCRLAHPQPPQGATQGPGEPQPAVPLPGPGPEPGLLSPAHRQGWSIPSRARWPKVQLESWSPGSSSAAQELEEKCWGSSFLGCDVDKRPVGTSKKVCNIHLDFKIQGYPGRECCCCICFNRAGVGVGVFFE